MSMEKLVSVERLHYTQITWSDIYSSFFIDSDFFKRILQIQQKSQISKFELTSVTSLNNDTTEMSYE